MLPAKPSWKRTCVLSTSVSPGRSMCWKIVFRTQEQGCGVGLFWPIPTPEVQLDHFLHHTPQLGIPVEMLHFLLKLLLKQIFPAVHHDFHWLLIVTKLLTTNFHYIYVKDSESEIFERPEFETDILPPTPQLCAGEWNYQSPTVVTAVLPANPYYASERTLHKGKQSEGK